MRQSLLKVWKDIKNKTYVKTSLWIIPLDAFKQQSLIEWQNIWTYMEFLKPDGTLKSKQGLELSQINLSWWERIQLESRYNRDKKEEFYLKPSQLEIVFKDIESKIIKKFYIILLKQEMEDKIVKHTMIRWAQDINETINLEEWETAWKDNSKMLKSADLRENFYKMMYRWHLTPAKLAKKFSRNHESLLEMW